MNLIHAKMSNCNIIICSSLYNVASAVTSAESLPAFIMTLAASLTVRAHWSQTTLFLPCLLSNWSHCCELHFFLCCFFFFFFRWEVNISALYRWRWGEQREREFEPNILTRYRWVKLIITFASVQSWSNGWCKLLGVSFSLLLKSKHSELLF